MTRIIVIGAGVGGLSAAAVLARAGLKVTVLEAQVYPGGCAGTYVHQGYRFDAGATLAGGFGQGGPMDLLARAADIAGWPARAADLAMLVHLPDGTKVPRWSDERRWLARHDAFGPSAEAFWRWQEHTAEAMWGLAMSLPAWPPSSIGEAQSLTGALARWLTTGSHTGPQRLVTMVMDALRPMASRMPRLGERFRLFVDAQLLISAQTTSRHANALYGAAALDLPRRGTVHLRGGMGAIAARLTKAVENNGGKVLLRHKASKIVIEGSRPVAVETRRQGTFPTDIVIANLTPWTLRRLIPDQPPRRLHRLPEVPQAGWGAFVLHVGLDASVVPKWFPLHHQLVLREPLAEGNSLFLSLSPPWDPGRAPQGRRALTISSHTSLESWWQLFENDRAGYEKLKETYAGRILAAAEAVLPGLREAADLVLPGTPVTFQRFTGRAWGWVGGFPQTDLFRTWPPRLGLGLWLVGDSVFPGQSTAATALGGLRVARSILQETHGPRQAASLWGQMLAGRRLPVHTTSRD